MWYRIINDSGHGDVNEFDGRYQASKSFGIYWYIYEHQILLEISYNSKIFCEQN